MATSSKSPQQAAADKAAADKARAEAREQEARLAEAAAQEKEQAEKALRDLAEQAQLEKAEADEAAEAKAKLDASAAEKLQDGGRAFVSAVHGRMVHPLTGQEFDVGSAVRAQVDNWVKVQVRAGKLKMED